MISIIVAIAEANAIGQKGDLLCHMSADLRHFKSITSGHTVIMGKRTWFSLPKHPLPGRRNIVISDVEGERLEGAEVVYSLEAAQQLIAADEEAFIIGGGMVYRQFLPLADKLYITHIHHRFEEADTFFPEIDATTWSVETAERHEADADNPYPYTFTTYTKR